MSKASTHPDSRRPRRRSALRIAYGLVRPVVRPLGWRLRTFLIGPLQDDVAQVRQEVAALRAEVTALRSVLEQCAAEQSGAALDEKILGVMEQALLTIALDREGQ